MRTLVCLLAAALGGLGAFALPAEASGSCGVRDHEIRGVARSRVLITRGPVVVYRVRHRAFDTYWGCSPRGPVEAILMGRDDRYAMRNELYGPTTAFGEIRVAGEWITAIHETGQQTRSAASTAKRGCEGRSTTLVMVNIGLRLVDTRKRVLPRVGNSGVAGLASGWDRLA